MGAYEPTERTRLQRKPSRGSHDRALIHQILDEALTCHVGFVEDGQPYVIPTIHARVGERLYLHGSPVSRTLRTLADGVACCVTATLIDGLALARSARQHSLNYRSAMVLGTAREVSDPTEKAEALKAVVDHIATGRSAEVRAPSAAELDTTAILSVALEEASAKIREGGPVDKSDDLALPVWAGQLPVTTAALTPIPDPKLPSVVQLPDYLQTWRSDFAT